MKIENAIGWCDETTNAVTGCDKVSAGCKNCYAQVGTRARVLRAQGIETWGPNGVRHPVAQFAQKLRRLNKLCVCDKCHEAHKWNELLISTTSPRPSPPFHGGEGDGTAGGTPTARCECGGTLRRIRLFADSNSDWLDEKWAIEVFANFLNEIRLAPNVDVLLLTKRPEKWRSRLGEVNDSLEPGCDLRKWITHWACHYYISTTSPRPSPPFHGGEGDGKLAPGIPHNIWIGVSVENQAMADLRIPKLLEIPASVRFLSCEPLLEGVNLVGPFDGDTAFPLGRGIDWVIVGGESGKDRRDCGVEAIVKVAEKCREFDVPVYVKQDCAFKSGEQGRIPAEIWGLKQFPHTKAVLHEVPAAPANAK